MKKTCQVFYLRYPELKVLYRALSSVDNVNHESFFPADIYYSSKVYLLYKALEKVEAIIDLLYDSEKYRLRETRE